MTRLTAGWGINDLDYPIRENDYVWDDNGKRKTVGRRWLCPFGRAWYNMVTRVYGKNATAAYKDVTICEEWKSAKSFKTWMETQDWEGKELDKDLLVPGNRVYSPETCCFVSHRVNTFLLIPPRKYGEGKLGVNYHRGRYEVNINLGDGKSTYLGAYGNEDDAHNAWLSAKLILAEELAKEESNIIIADAIRSYWPQFELMKEQEENDQV